MKPKPLNFEDTISRLKDEIQQIEEELYEIKKDEKLFRREDIINLYKYKLLWRKTEVQTMITLIKNVKQRIKSACEFYLRYKDKPELLFEEKRKYRATLAHLFGDDKNTSRYNKWLFELIFKDVLEEEKKE
ncbi:MAG: hypothetical protein J7L14_02885 [Candidatus Diapherotrites archaeon]|nr:hypothetical protein [Candidatus Diapherotrites archaeon]